MKSIILGFIYLGTFALGYFVLSLFGMLWLPYSSVITSFNWFMWYTVCFGWWISLFPTREYYMANEEYFKRVL